MLDSVSVARRGADRNRDLRRQHLTRRVWALGARPVYELLIQLDRDHHLGADLDRQLERYAGLAPAVLRALGGDKFPHRPLRVVPK